MKTSHGRERPLGSTGIRVFLVTDFMGFAGLMGAYVALRVGSVVSRHPGDRLGGAGAFGLTLVMLASSATMWAAVRAAEVGEGARTRARLSLLVTAALGLAFVAGQMAMIRAFAVEPGVGLTSSPIEALLFVLAGYHGLHVLVGVALLLRSAKLLTVGASAAVPGVAVEEAARFGVESLYWQFLGAVWLALVVVVRVLAWVCHV